MSDYDFSSSLSSYGSGNYGIGSSGSGNNAQKQQVMEQVRNQVAVAQAQELLQVCSHFYMYDGYSFLSQRGLITQELLSSMSKVIKAHFLDDA